MAVGSNYGRYINRYVTSFDKMNLENASLMFISMVMYEPSRIV